MNREWTDEEIELLRRDRAAKVPVPVTAAKLNRPVPATYLRARMIGTQVQKHQPWSDDEVSRLRALVMSNPPMTDKRIAEELGRTITQVRWKMQDLGLIGARDLSKLAKITAAASPSRQASTGPAMARPREHHSTGSEQLISPTKTPESQKIESLQPTSKQLVTLAISRLATELDRILKSANAESEMGMRQAAMAAIGEKRAIDERLAALRPSKVRLAAFARGCAQGTDAQASVYQAPAVEKPRTLERMASQPRGVSAVAARKAGGDGPKVRARQLGARPFSKPPSPPPSSPPPPAPVPKIVVLEAPAIPRADQPASEVPQTSGRGGWKSVRRDPARIAAQARAKSANRADAIDLAHAAQAAIEQFIAQRGVTRSGVGGTQALVTRLQARGYIVVGDGEGWVIDQRHHVANDKELIAFAAARGVSLDAAA